MPNTEINSYISKARLEGTSDEIIKSSLLSVGWPVNSVEEALSATKDSPGIPLPNIPIPKAPAGNMWDSFQHILMFISMYVLYISLALMIHQYIDKWSPGIDTRSYDGSYDFNSILLRGYMAALIVSFPLFSFFFLKITKQTKANPAIRNLASRKMLIYATLVITFVVVLVNVVQAVYGFLNGNVTLNFILHFLNTVGLSSIIFVYYLNQVKGDRTNNA